MRDRKTWVISHTRLTLAGYSSWRKRTRWPDWELAVADYNYKTIGFRTCATAQDN